MAGSSDSGNVFYACGVACAADWWWLFAVCLQLLEYIYARSGYLGWYVGDGSRYL